MFSIETNDTYIIIYYCLISVHSLSILNVLIITFVQKHKHKNWLINNNKNREAELLINDYKNSLIVQTPTITIDDILAKSWILRIASRRYIRVLTKYKNNKIELFSQYYLFMTFLQKHLDYTYKKDLNNLFNYYFKITFA